MATLNDGARLFAAWMDFGPQDQRGQPAVARLLGCTQPTVSNWKAGKSKPDYLFRVALRALTGIAVQAWDRPGERRALAQALRRIERAATAG